LSQDDSFSVLGDYMGSEESDRVMTLLQELAMLKEADVAFEANPTESEREECRLRQQRRDDIGLEIKALADQKKASQTASEP
jgi:hypothetical protein